MNNTTDGLNKLVSALIESEDDTVLVTRIEHHANDLSWRERCNVIVYGDTENIDDRVGVVSFNFSDLNSYAPARVLSEVGGVATRRGAFCAHPYVWRLMGISEDRLGEFEECTDVNTPGMIRVSFGIYNTEKEVDKLLEMLPSLIELAKQEVDTQYSRAEPAF